MPFASARRGGLTFANVTGLAAAGRESSLGSFIRDALDILKCRAQLGSGIME